MRRKYTTTQARKTLFPSDVDSFDECRVTADDGENVTEDLYEIILISNK